MGIIHILNIFLLYDLAVKLALSMHIENPGQLPVDAGLVLKLLTLYLILSLILCLQVMTFMLFQVPVMRVDSVLCHKCLQ